MFTNPGGRYKNYAPRGRWRYVRKIYNVAGTYTLKLPRDFEPWTPLKASLWGAGGSGGGVTTTASSSSSGGGGGGFCDKIFAAVFSAGQSLTLVVGAHGNAPSAGANVGNAGTASTFSTLTANGGAAGLAGTTAANFAGVAGGTATGGDINITGQNGGPLLIGTGTGFTMVGGGVQQAYSLCGGSAPMGGGQGGSPPSANTGGNIGIGPGAGGSAVWQNASAGTARAGGAGVDGQVIIELWTADPNYVNSLNV